MDYIFGGISDNGSKTPMNQDSCFAGTIVSAIGELAFLLVCDGMGGTDKGEMASATLVDEMADWFYRKQKIGPGWEPDLYSVRREWGAVVSECNDNIIKYGLENRETLGSTIVALLITPQDVLCMNIGDSRCYRIDEKMCRISTDDSVVGDEIARGILTEEEAKRDPRNNQLTQCVGIMEDIGPHFYTEPVRNGVYLVCSDGFYNKLSNDEMRTELLDAYMGGGEGIQVVLERFVNLNRCRGEADDITAVVAGVIR